MTGYLYFVFWFFISFVFVSTLILSLAGVELRRYVSRARTVNLRLTLRSPLAPSISVIAPGYNEEAGIADSIRSLLALDYPDYEVIAINDGSKDATLQRLIDAFDLRLVTRPTPPFLAHHPVRGVYAPRGKLRLLVIDKENSGKADSVNAGINFASGELVCVVDSDSILEQDALAKTALPFIEDPVKTVATGGMVRVVNGCRVAHGHVLETALPKARWAMFQVVEYMRAFFATRTGWTAMNALLIISGAFGLFRRDLLISVGGYRLRTVGDDMEMAVRLHRYCREHKRPYRILYVPDPVCWTEVPETSHDLRKQRRRWHQACLEVLWYHRIMVFNPRYRQFGMIALPALVIFEVLGPAVELSGYAVSAAMLLLGLLTWQNYLLFLALAVLYGLFLTLGALLLEDVTANRFPAWQDLRRVMLYALGENCGARQLMHVWRMEGFWTLIRRRGYESLERKGFSE